MRFVDIVGCITIQDTLFERLNLSFLENKQKFKLEQKRLKRTKKFELEHEHAKHALAIRQGMHSASFVPKQAFEPQGKDQGFGDLKKKRVSSSRFGVRCLGFFILGLHACRVVAETKTARTRWTKELAGLHAASGCSRGTHLKRGKLLSRVNLFPSKA
ncbi:hypothetical protein H5410_030011 [Solanum commersonii]|uniref:Uncharacterized protein n=1 Tax=Solanum commersonii TaxID=4109 RepID=A0A9J5YEE8_SOLCO|nr:hypothetical protein H5410_030011 [Solanum commersonii]